MPKSKAKPARVVRAIEWAMHCKANTCPACSGTARGADGGWCRPCGATGLSPQASRP